MSRSKRMLELCGVKIIEQTEENNDTVHCVSGKCNLHNN